MPVVGARKSVVATAGGTLLATGAGGSNDARPVSITNRDATASVDLGGAGVTSGSGVELKAGESRTFTLMGGDDLYAIAASGTVRVDVLVGRS